MADALCDVQCRSFRQKEDMRERPLLKKVYKSC